MRQKKEKCRKSEKLLRSNLIFKRRPLEGNVLFYNTITSNGLILFSTLMFHVLSVQWKLYLIMEVKYDQNIFYCFMFKQVKNEIKDKYYRYNRTELMLMWVQKSFKSFIIQIYFIFISVHFV